MAIGYTLMMADKKLTEDILQKKLKLLGNDGFKVSVHDSKVYPYNEWDSIFLRDIFTYERMLDIRLDKEYTDWEKRYQLVFHIIFDLMAELNERALLVNYDCAELCFFREDGKVVLNHEMSLWNRACIQKILVGWDVI